MGASAAGASRALTNVEGYLLLKGYIYDDSSGFPLIRSG